MRGQPTPDAVRTLGLVNLVGGLANATLGGLLASTVLSFGGAVCTGMCTMGFCPFGGVLGVFGFLVMPLGLVEAAIGLATLVSPESARPLLRLLPYTQLAAILLGDVISPILGMVGLALTRDPEVTAYLEGI